jgi:hypothetical protein
MKVALRCGVVGLVVMGLARATLAETDGHSRCDNAVNAYSAGSAVIAVVGGPFGLGWGIGAGLGQCGYYIYRSVKDPPDTADAGTPVDLSSVLAGNTIPSYSTLIPSMDPVSAADFDQMNSDLSLMVAQARAVNMSLDRSSGAIELGNWTWAQDRYNEAQSFLTSLQNEQYQFQTDLQTTITRTDLVDPGLLSAQVTQTDLMNMANETVAGDLPSLEPVPFTYWNISSDEEQFMETSAATITPSTISDYFNDYFGGAQSTSVENLLIQSTDVCIPCMLAQQLAPLPEPSVVAILSVGAVSGLYQRRRRRC